MVNPSELMINDVFQHHREIQVRPCKERGVPGDILPNIPEDSILGGLGGAGAKELDAADPQAGDAVVLLSFTIGVEMEENAGPRGRAMRGRDVGGGEGRRVDGIGEGVA